MRDILDYRTGIIIALYCMLKPIYLSTSGSMQICDIFFVLAVLYLFISHRGIFRFSYSDIFIIKSLALWSLYIALINAVWFIALRHTDFIRYTLYYIFNFLAFTLCFVIKRQIGLEKVEKAFCTGCFISVVIIAIGLIIYRGNRIRSLGFFNNPNQLGYYALLMVTCVFLLPERFSVYRRFIIILVSIWAIINSGSKAAFLAVVGLIFIHLLIDEDSSTKKGKIRNLLLLGVAAVALYAFFFSDLPYFTGNRVIRFMRRRIMRLASENDTAFGSGRGYDRVFEMGIHVLWGMGEGAYNRFQVMYSREVHSTYISTLVSYGVFGFIGLLFFGYNLVVGKTYLRHNICSLSGVLLYFLTHNGIRNTILWMMLAIIWMRKHNEDLTKEMA